MNDIFGNIFINIVVAFLGGGAFAAWVTRRTPSKDREQEGMEKWYAAVIADSERKDKRIIDLEDLLRSREEFYRGKLEEKDERIDAVERNCALCEAREQGYKDRIDSLHSTIQQLTVQIERLQRQQGTT